MILNLGGLVVEVGLKGEECMNNQIIAKVLIVVTSHGQLGSTGKPTGYYLPEVSHPAHVFEQKGIEFDIASPRGGQAPMDEASRDLTDKINKDFLSRKNFRDKLDNTIALKDVKPEEYKAVLFAGGHGTMWDFVENKDIERISAKIYESGGVVAAVCHGPAALVNIKLTSGKYLIAGKNVTGFSNLEEDAVSLSKVVPFSLEDKLVERGGKFSKASMWQSHVVVDQKIITGQNPASAGAVGEAIAKILKQ